MFKVCSFLFLILTFNSYAYDFISVNVKFSATTSLSSEIKKYIAHGSSSKEIRTAIFRTKKYNSKIKNFNRVERGTTAIFLIPAEVIAKKYSKHRKVVIKKGRVTLKKPLSLERLVGAFKLKGRVAPLMIKRYNTHISNWSLIPAGSKITVIYPAKSKIKVQKAVKKKEIKKVDIKRTANKEEQSLKFYQKTIFISATENAPDGSLTMDTQSAMGGGVVYSYRIDEEFIDVLSGGGEYIVLPTVNEQAMPAVMSIWGEANKSFFDPGLSFGATLEYQKTVGTRYKSSSEFYIREVTHLWVMPSASYRYEVFDQNEIMAKFAAGPSLMTSTNLETGETAKLSSMKLSFSGEYMYQGQFFAGVFYDQITVSGDADISQSDYGVTLGYKHSF